MAYPYFISDPEPVLAQIPAPGLPSEEGVPQILLDLLEVIDNTEKITDREKKALYAHFSGTRTMRKIQEALGSRE